MKINIKQYNSKVPKTHGEVQSYGKGPKRPRPVIAEGLRGVEKELWLKRKAEYLRGKWHGNVEYVGETYEVYGLGDPQTIKPGQICEVVCYEQSEWGEFLVKVCFNGVEKRYGLQCFKPINATPDEIQYAIIEKEIYGKIR